MQKHSALIALFDTNTLFRQALHNSIEHVGFSIAFSCSEEKQLFSNLEKGTQPSVLLMNADYDWKNIYRILKKVKTAHKKLHFIVYMCEENKAAIAEFVKEGVKVLSDCSIESLSNALDSLYPAEVEVPGKKFITLPESVRKLLKNTKNLAVLKGMASSKSNPDIARDANLSANSVKTYKQRILSALESKSASEAVAKSKDYGII
jgi:DNA-binding NarL/FixJ family response regulator